MKKIIFAAAALFAFGFANAQDAKEDSAGGGYANGDVFITGGIGITSFEEGDVSSSIFNISPKIGFFVSDNIAIGGRLGYRSETADVYDADLLEYGEEKYSTLMVGAFGRYYTTPSSDFSFFAELGVDYMSTTVDVPGGDYKETGFGIALSPGISYFMSDHFALEASIGVLGYNTMKPDYDGAENRNTFDIGVNMEDVMVGVVYKF